MQTLRVLNPANHEILGEVPIVDSHGVIEAVAKARDAQRLWKDKSFKERKTVMLHFRDLILEHLDLLAVMISKENGKPLIEAIGHDLMPAMDLITYFAKEAKDMLKPQKVCLGKWGPMGRKSIVEFEPYGVVGIIAPWNFPFSIPVGGLVMALMAGNAVVLKPSEYTPLIALKIAQLLRQANLPKDLLQVVTGDGSTGQALVNAGVDKILFTGSVATGKRIMAEAAKTLTPVSLELGGKDPFLVLPDADLDLASSAAVWGAFCNSGQVCASVERVYVHSSIEKPFTDLVLEKTKQLRQGLGQTTEVEMGAMTVPAQLEKIEKQLEEAKARGAQILFGGKRAATSGQFFEPTVLKGATHEDSIIKDETFGPVLPILTYQNEEELVRLANDSPYALNAYIFTRNWLKGKNLASQIQAGTVNVNESVFTHALPQTPWGGPKESGIGTTHGVWGLMELVKMRHIHINTQSSKFNNFWWYGYSEDKLKMMKALCHGLFGKGIARVGGLVKFLLSMGKVQTM